MSPGVAARRRFGFALGCGCKDPKAVAVAAAAVAASSPRSGTEASTATTATSRRARTHPSGSGSASTGTLTVPSASSSFLWEDADGDGDGEEVEVEFKRPSSATTPSFSGLLRELSELERSVKSCARKSPGRNHFSPPPPPPPPPPLPARPVSGDDDKAARIREGHGNFSPPPPPPPPPPPLQLRPLQRRAAVRSDDKPSIKEGHGDFSPPRPRPPSLQVQTQQHRRVKSVDKVNRQEGDPHFTLPLPPRPLPPPPPLDPLLPRAKAEEDGAKKEDSKRASTPPKHRKAKSCDATTNTNGVNRLVDGSVAVVKQSEDPLGDFRRSMLNMIVENGIVAGDELRELLRRFLALNAPRHHDAILRAFAEIWDEVFAAPATAADPQHREPSRQSPAPRQRTPPRRRQSLPAWRV